MEAPAWRRVSAGPQVSQPPVSAQPLEQAPALAGQLEQQVEVLLSEPTAVTAPVDRLPELRLAAPARRADRFALARLASRLFPLSAQPA